MVKGRYIHCEKERLKSRVEWINFFILFQVCLVLFLVRYTVGDLAEFLGSAVGVLQVPHSQCRNTERLTYFAAT
jgi:hypothetical protein